MSLEVRIKRLDAELPLPAYAHPGDAGADLETIVARPRRIVLEDIAAEIHAGGVETLTIDDGLPFKIPPVRGLITQNADELIEIGAERMCQWLVVVAIVGDAIVVLVRKGPDDIGLELQIEIFHVSPVGTTSLLT